MIEPVNFIAGLITIVGVLVKPTQWLIKKHKERKSQKTNEPPKKNEALELKRKEQRAEAVKPILALIPKIQKAINHIRDPYFEDVNTDDVVTLRFRYHDTRGQLIKYKNLFDTLGEEHVRIKTMIGDKPAETAIKDILTIYDILTTDVEKLIFHAQHGKSGLALVQKLEQQIYKNDDETDEISKTIKKAVRKIETRLTPYVRMEK